jgi:hypothetical protein
VVDYAGCGYGPSNGFMPVRLPLSFLLLICEMTVWGVHIATHYPGIHASCNTAISPDSDN